MMKSEQIKKSASVADMINALSQLLKENLIGLVAEEDGKLSFTLPNRQAFLVSICEKA